MPKIIRLKARKYIKTLAHTSECYDNCGRLPKVPVKIGNTVGYLCQQCYEKRMKLQRLENTRIKAGSLQNYIIWQEQGQSQTMLGVE